MPTKSLGAVASFLSVLLSHLNRISDRFRDINAIPEKTATSAHLKATLPQLRNRVANVGRAIYWAVGSGIATCVLMIVAFVSAYFGVRHELSAAILFTVSLALFTVSLIYFGYEVRGALKHLERG